MALEESSYPASRLAISPNSLPVNTPPKAIKWKHLDGSFCLSLTAVASRMRLQLKQDGKPIAHRKITTALNKLAPAQKKLASAPRLQYQDCRMSFRYPSSPQIDNGLSERFQLTLDEQASVRLVVQKLTPFFVVVAPKATAPESQAATPVPASGSSTPSASRPVPNKKRKADAAVGEATDSSPEGSIPNRRKVADADIAARTNAGSISRTGLARNSAPTQTPSPSFPAQADHPPVREESGSAASVSPSSMLSSPSAADPDMDAVKASLLSGFRSEAVKTATATQQSQRNGADRTHTVSADQGSDSTLVNQQSQHVTSSIQAVWTPSETLVSAQLQSQATLRQTRHGTSMTTSNSTEQLEAEINLLPPSPLVDTSSPPYIALPSVSLGIETDLLDLHFSSDGMDDDGLADAYPPMMTPFEERMEREKRRMDEEEWEEEQRQEMSSSQVNEASYFVHRNEGHELTIQASRELQGIWQSKPTSASLDLAHIDSMIRHFEPTDAEIQDAMQRGDLSESFIDMCYRVVHAVENGYADQQEIVEVENPSSYSYDLVPDLSYQQEMAPRRFPSQVCEPRNRSVPYHEATKIAAPVIGHYNPGHRAYPQASNLQEHLLHVTATPACHFTDRFYNTYSKYDLSTPLQHDLPPVHNDHSTTLPLDQDNGYEYGSRHAYEHARYHDEAHCPEISPQSYDPTWEEHHEIDDIDD